MNADLCRLVSTAKIREAAFSISGDNAPGPDGLTWFFFQQFWDLVKHQIISEVQGFFSTGILPATWNHTNLCLIPKIPAPNRMTDLRPISLCSVLYKIISKILINRLKKHLPNIISPTQAPFVSERIITDNIMIAHKVVHSLHSHPEISKSSVLLKTDMSKAYDRLEWPFLEGILQVMGFAPLWISWIMGCVTSLTFSVLINGHPYGFIKPERGIRQGDPLSPFLFVISTEALIHLFNQAEINGSITGIQYHLSGPSINHLLFVDDSLFLCQASKIQCEEVLLCLHTYELMSGQQINLAKSTITFGSKVTEDLKDWIKNRTNIQLEGGTGKYLGLPECLSGSKQQLLGFIKDRLQSKLTGWYAKTLSQGGKEVLLKSVAMALPVYAMSCFKLPKITIKKLTSAMMEYWWSNSQSQHKFHWISHEKMTLQKSAGGFGFRDLELFNQALLAKQAWRLLYNPHCLFSRFFRSRYYNKTSFLQSKLGSRPSYGWRSILFGKDLLLKGLKRVIGDGQDTLVWIDKWIFDDMVRRPIGLHSLMNICLRASDLIDPSSGLWNISLLRSLFHQDDVFRILSTKLLLAKKDSYCWAGNRSRDILCYIWL